MLPAIVFIFSRAACDDAVRQVMRDVVRLTDAQERTSIREVAERRAEPAKSGRFPDALCAFGQVADGQREPRRRRGSPMPSR